jgi:hypothetical protein
MGLAMVLIAPSLASAQLLPDLPIRRKRQDCSQENPQYKVIRQEYWGYYPTCWRKFPPGWGCPSPEAPNWEAAQKILPLTPLDKLSSTKPEPPPANDGGNDGMDRPGVRPGRPNDTNLPTPPDSSEDIFKPRKPTTPPDTKPPGPADPFTAPAPAPAPSDPPKEASTSGPAPLGDPSATTAAPRRRQSLVASLFSGRRR